MQEKQKIILKWIFLIPVFTIIIIVANIVIDYLLLSFNIGCENNYWIDCSQLNQSNSFSYYLWSFWFDLSIIFLALQFCLEFIGEKYFKKTFIILSLWIMLSLFISIFNYSYISDLSLIGLVLLFLPSILVFGYVGYRIFYKNDPIIYFNK